MPPIFLSWKGELYGQITRSSVNSSLLCPGYGSKECPKYLQVGTGGTCIRMPFGTRPSIGSYSTMGNYRGSYNGWSYGPGSLYQASSPQEIEMATPLPVGQGGFLR